MRSLFQFKVIKNTNKTQKTDTNSIQSKFHKFIFNNSGVNKFLFWNSMYLINKKIVAYLLGQGNLHTQKKESI